MRSLTSINCRCGACHYGYFDQQFPEEKEPQQWWYDTPYIHGGVCVPALYCPCCGDLLAPDGTAHRMTRVVATDEVKQTSIYRVCEKLINAQRECDYATFADGSEEDRLNQGFLLAGLVSEDWEHSDPDGCGEYCHHEHCGYYIEGTEVETVFAALCGGVKDA